MRRRRQIEAERGYELLRGTFAQVLAGGRRRPRCRPPEIRALLEQLRVRPVITAHPTEAKRVTVLEKHRRIYRRLVDLESPRWTPRERQSLIDGLRNEIELLWLTGELRLQKPTVPQEVFWGLHFFNETLFEAVPDLLDKLERVLAHVLSRTSSWVVPPFFQFGSWIGGDRDGNPFVTNDVTRSTLLENRLTGAPALPPAASTSWCARSASPRRRCRSQRPVPRGARPRAGGDRAGRGDRQPESGRGVPPVPRLHAAPDRGDDRATPSAATPGPIPPATPRPTRCSRISS